MTTAAAKIKNILYAYAFFEEFILIYPLYAVMFADKGLSAAQISSLFIVWSLTSFVLEVPSGSIADKYPRKYVLFAAQLFQIVAFSFWLFMPSFAGFLTGFVLWGVTSALVSGTKEALVYDELKRLDDSKSYTRVIGRMETIGLLATIAAGFGAALLAKSGYGIILALSLAAIGVSMAIIALIPRAKAAGSTGEVRYWQYFSAGVKLAFAKRKVLLIIMFIAIVTGLGAIDEYYSLLFNEQGLSNMMIAFWIGVIYMFGAAASLFAYKLENKRIPLVISLLLWALTLLAATILPPSLGPLAIGLHVAFVYLIRVLFNTRLQDEIDDTTRATTTSVGGFMSEFGAVVTFGLFAIVAGRFSYALGFQITAGIIVVLAAVFGILHRRYGLKA